MPDKALTALAVVCGVISVACCSAAVNVSSPATTYEGADIAATSAAAGLDRQEKDMLHWAIEHSDPEKLKAAAQALKDPASSARRQREMQAVLEAMRQEPSEADLMKAAIEELTAANATDADKVAAMLRLRDLVRPIDNANDLKPLGGFAPLIMALNSSNPDVQAAAAGVLGTAASNNVRAQQDVAEDCPDVVQKLLQVVQSNHTEAASKGLYALGKFLLNSAPQQQQFFQQGGMGTLQQLVADERLPEALRWKLLDLIGDLAKDGLQQHLQLAPEFLLAVVAMLDRALPVWPNLERGLNAASALASASPQAGAQLLAKGLRKTLDAARSALVQGAQHGDEDDRAFVQELLQLVDQVERQVSGAASRIAADAATGGPAPGAAAAAAAAGNGAAAAAAAARGTAAAGQPEVVMLGPAKGAGDEGSKPAGGSGRSTEEL